MDWISWALLVAVSLIAGGAGSFLYSRRTALLQVATPIRRRLPLRLRIRLRRQRREQRAATRTPSPPRQDSEDVLVLIPDGRPWPLGPALQLLELAWRWQVVHGANLPLRARQGEGAYVWRPPLPARTSSDQPGAEAEH